STFSQIFAFPSHKKDRLLSFPQGRRNGAGARGVPPRPRKTCLGEGAAERLGGWTLAAAARNGAAPAVVKGGRVLNVFTGVGYPAAIVLLGGRMAGVVPPGEGGGVEGEVLAATDWVIVPGYVEPHAQLGLLAEPVRTLEQMAATG